MEFKRFDGIYWFISFSIVLIINIVTWFNSSSTLKDILSNLFLLIFVGLFLSYHIYKWFQEED